MYSGIHENRRAGRRLRGLLVSVSCLPLVAGGLAAAPALAQAQQEAVGPQRFELEEIVVTSRRYEERIQDAPVSVSVMSTEFIADQRIRTADDVIALTPGATFVRFNKLQPEYNIRGISGDAEGTSREASIVTVVDNMPVSKDFMKNPGMYDMARVEVLRGPQGTAFGRNAAAGLVHLVTQRPTPEFEASITGTAGKFGLFEADGFVNVPVSDAFALRAAFNFDHDDGFMESASTGKGLNGQENFSFRGSALFEPDDRLSIYLKAEYNEDNDETPVRRSRDCEVPMLIQAGSPLRNQFGAPPNHPPWPITFFDPCDTFKTEISEGDFFLKREILTLTGEIAWEFAEGYTLTSVTGYMDGEVDQFQDANGTPLNVLFQVGLRDADIFTQEIRIDNHASADRLRWLGGFLFLTDEDEFFSENQFFQPNLDGSPTLPFPRIPTFDTKLTTNETDSYGVFGELNYDVTDALTATFGIRWNRDEKEGTILHTGSGFGAPIAALDGCNFDPPQFICGTPENPVGITEPVDVSDSWDDVMLKASVEYRVAPDHMLYFLFSQGFKSGGFQPEPPNVATALQSFDAETSNNYEIGWRGTIDNRYRIGLTGYLINLNNAQLAQFIDVGGLGFFQAVSNAGSIESLGVELEYEALVTADFRISGTLAVQDAELKDSLVVFDPGVGPEDVSGIRPDNAPKWTATFVAAHDFHLGDGSTITLRGDIRARSNVWDDIIDRDLEFDGRLRPSAFILGSQLSWTSRDDHIKASVWVRNLNKEKEVTNIGPPQPNNFQRPTAFGEPRIFGGTVTYSYF